VKIMWGVPELTRESGERMEDVRNLMRFAAAVERISAACPSGTTPGPRD
jgi:hypothetical protein